MGLNQKIGGEVDVHGTSTTSQVFEKAIKKENKLKFIVAFVDKFKKKLKKVRIQKEGLEPTIQIKVLMTQILEIKVIPTLNMIK